MKWLKVEVGAGVDKVTHLLNLDSVGRLEARVVNGRGQLYAYLEDIAGKDYGKVVDVTPPSRGQVLLDRLVLFLGTTAAVFDVRAELDTIP